MSVIRYVGITEETFNTKVKEWIMRGDDPANIEYRANKVVKVLALGLSIYYDPNEGYVISPVIGADIQKIMDTCWSLVEILGIRWHEKIKCEINGVVITWGFR